MSTLLRRQAGGAAALPSGSGWLVLPGLSGDLVLPSLPGALCKGADPEMWFPPGASPGAAEAAEAAKRVCGICPARAECLQWALETGEMAGVWGGTTPAERARMRRAGRGG